MSESIIIGIDGKPIKVEKDLPCPRCGAGPEKRVPSCSFGLAHLICFCGYEFKEIPCQAVML